MAFAMRLPVATPMFDVFSPSCSGPDFMSVFEKKMSEMLDDEAIGSDASSECGSECSDLAGRTDSGLGSESAAAAALPELSCHIATFPRPTAFAKHTNPETGELEPCCLAASAFLEGATMASSAKHGVAGVLDVLCTRFNWGTARCWHLCDCLKQKQIDCGSGTNVAAFALSMVPEVVEKKTRVCKVQMVQRWHSWQAEQRRAGYADVEDPAEREFLSAWISDHSQYHQCVGLIQGDGSNSLRLWDYGGWHLPPVDWAADRSILAIKLTLEDDDAAALAGASLDWHGLKIPAGEWVSLLPADVAATAALGVPNVTPITQGMSAAAKQAVLGTIFAPHSMTSHSPAAAPAAPVDVRVAAAAPTVFIGGNHMSSNPCPGAGVSRAIRLRFPTATTVAIENRDDALTGMNEQTFSSAIPVDDVMMPHLDEEAKAQHFSLVTELLTNSPEAFYLPCSDAEIDRCAEALEAAPIEIGAKLLGRVLCPPPAAVALTEKPQIEAAKSMGIFEVPAYITLDAETHSQTDIETFCKVRGYPVLVKGPVQGAKLCGSWSAVLAAVSSKWGSGGYVQVAVTGFQYGLAYAAYAGELTACVLMEKTQYIGSKAWGGNLRPAPVAMVEALRAWCKAHNWTGGGELEYIEDMDGKLHAIDWNPRFPAWIFGGCYAGVNLPGALIQHALSTRVGSVVPFPVDVAEASATAFGGFTRTCVEIPTGMHAQVAAQAGFAGCTGYADYSKAGHVPTGKPKMDMLPKSLKLGAGVEREIGAVNEEVAGKAAATDAKPLGEDEVAVDLEAREQIETEINRLIPADAGALQTPRFLLSRATVRDNLLGHKAAVQRALDEIPDAPALNMCISVKTQPHHAVLNEARAAGYLGEVITTAEMQACLDAGWAPGEIVMNGPGKWYGDVSGPRSSDPRPSEPIRCVFADSLADLRTILARMADPEDWFDAAMVGVRFSPPWVVSSRFGLNCKDPKVLLEAAELLNRLPAHVGIGLHMHFASSTVGLEQWFGLARGYLRVVENFAKLLVRAPTVLDFGGGWPSHLLDHAAVHPHLVRLLKEATEVLPGLEAVQFEPGKSITERAGAVLTKVLEIRETEKKTPMKNDDDADDIDEDDEQYRAAIVDACISDMGSMPLHVHPLVWQRDGDWSTLESGKDQVWGSICMEFDILGAQFALPDGAAAGDHVLIAFTGAYDTTMAYDFADGKERDIHII